MRRPGSVRHLHRPAPFVLVFVLAGCSLFGPGDERIEVSGTVYVDSVPAVGWPVRLRVITDFYRSGPTVAETRTDTQGRYQLAAEVPPDDCGSTTVEPGMNGPLETCEVYLYGAGGGRCGVHENVDFYCAT